MGLIWFALIGLAAGWIARQIMKGEGYGFLGDLIVGMLGAVVGGFLFGLLGFKAVGLVGGLISATVGAIVLITALRYTRK